MQTNNGYAKQFDHYDNGELYFVRFDQGKRNINGKEYWFEGFFNSKEYIIREVICIPLENRISYQVWYQIKGSPPKHG